MSLALKGILLESSVCWKKSLRSQDKFKEIWIHHPSGAKLCGLISGEIGWLMFLRHEGDTGFSTRNSSIDDEREIEFRLNNGQADFYPLSWTYPVDVIGNALEEFSLTGEIPKVVEWHDDSV